MTTTTTTNHKTKMKNITTAPVSTKFAVVWFSPRGFANEGSYFYGTEAEMEQLHESYDPCQSRYSYIGGNRTLDAAQANAERLARRDRRETPRGELCHISAAPFLHYIG